LFPTIPQVVPAFIPAITHIHLPQSMGLKVKKPCSPLFASVIKKNAVHILRGNHFNSQKNPHKSAVHDGISPHKMPGNWQKIA
jgi:hypothetical protein